MSSEYLARVTIERMFLETAGIWPTGGPHFSWADVESAITARKISLVMNSEMEEFSLGEILNCHIEN